VKYVSTRGEAPAVGFSEAITSGLAPDGGLYVPERFPGFDRERFDPAAPFAEIATGFIAPFLEGDPLAPHVASMCERAFDFPLPLERLDERTSLLELFHGPTAAFKDFGARFLAECFQRIASGESAGGPARPMTVLVATSGDTGGAVAAAFHLKRGVRVGVLYPRGGVSPRQERHLTCWTDNVKSFSVAGTFDDCQRMVKGAFRDEAWRRSARLTSANSINIGRLLPQAAYYAATALRHAAERGNAAGVVVPSGNLGNSVGAFWARHVGFPIGRIVLACNANRTVPDWFETGEWSPRASIATLANAMDVGDPSNMERLFHLFPERDELLAGASALSVDDATIRETIAAGPERWGRVWCPHTATAVHALDSLPKQDWVVVATAHPAKFEETVAPLIGAPVEPPPALAELLSRPRSVTEIDADLERLKAELDG
jgi:threonine synthase